MIARIARAVRANDLAAAGVARHKAMQQELKHRLEARHNSAEERKRALDAERLDKIQAHLRRIAAAVARRCELTQMRLLVAEHEAVVTLNMHRPPPVDLPPEDLEADIIYTPRHVEAESSSPELSSDGEYASDQETG